MVFRLPEVARRKQEDEWAKRGNFEMREKERRSKDAEEEQSKHEIVRRQVLIARYREEEARLLAMPAKEGASAARENAEADRCVCVCVCLCVSVRVSAYMYVYVYICTCM